MRMLSILIADSHPVARRGLRALLEAQPGWKVVGEASNGREAVEKAKQLRPDLAILDISMPELNGPDATQLILKATPNTRVLILAMHSAPDLISEALNAGARGYVLKSDAEADTDLVKAVAALSHGRTFFTDAASELLLDNLQRGSGKHSPLEVNRLTVREREVLQLLAEGKSNKEVAVRLKISVRTAENHRAKIMRKLHLHSFSDLIRFAIRNNMVDLQTG
jgi:DNA-binding NarL/FixJ family response regulator